ncbi:MAG: RNA methyltransferase, partial [Pseudomonadota bacterium]
ENLARTRLEAQLVTADALDWTPDEPFDLILLDAPCTATGTIRRHPELPHIRDGGGVEAATSLQSRLLSAAWPMLKPGGRLIYATCSLNRAEGERQAEAFLAARPDAARIPVTAEETGDPALITKAGDYRARPDFWDEIGGMDGFFATRIAKRA